MARLDLLHELRDRTDAGRPDAPAVMGRLATLNCGQPADWRWTGCVRASIRYITNSGGMMPQSKLTRLRQSLPRTNVFLIYGLTESLRSTYPPPEEADQRAANMEPVE